VKTRTSRRSLSLSAARPGFHTPVVSPECGGTEVKMNIRPIEPKEYSVLDEFLYHAVFLPPGTVPPPREIIYKPEIFVYINNFGQKDDVCVVADCDGKIAGAAWARIIPAFGHVDDGTPELAVSVLPDCRAKGVGTKLLTGLFALLSERGYKQTSLSVQKENPAVRLYRRLGYEIIKENAEDFIMIKRLDSAAQGQR
jgi:ribosomal protein S18 acetylase RimI-like enzyme